MFNDQEKTAKKRLMNRIFNRLLNVKGTVVEDARIADSPLRSEPVLEIRVHPRAGMLRCFRCGERRPGYDQGGGARRWRHQKIRRRRPDILRTIELGYSNARLEAFNNRIKVTIRTAYGFHHANNLIALIMLRCGGLDIRLPQPRTQPTKTAEASFLCYPVKLRDGSSFSPFEPCRPTSPFADRDTITPRMAEFQRFRNSYCGTPR